MSAQHEDIASDPMRSLPPRQPELEWLVRETMLSRGMKESRVLDAIRRVPRQAFVPTTLAEMAYDDRPLPIGWGQTISQPYIVAFMTDAAMPQSTGVWTSHGAVGLGGGITVVDVGDVRASEYGPEGIESITGVDGT